MKVAIQIKGTLVSWGMLHIIQERYPNVRVEMNPGLHKLISSDSPEYKLIILDPSLVNSPGHVTMDKIYTRNPDCKLIAVSSKTLDECLTPYFDGVIYFKDSENKILSVLAGILDSYEEQDTETSSTDLISKREKDVLRGVALGLTNKEISENLNISCHTVITHRKNISAKIGIKTIAGLTVYAVLHGIIDPEELDSF